MISVFCINVLLLLFDIELTLTSAISDGPYYWNPLPQVEKNKRSNFPMVGPRQLFIIP